MTCVKHSVGVLVRLLTSEDLPLTSVLLPTYSIGAAVGVIPVDFFMAGIIGVLPANPVTSVGLIPLLKDDTMGDGLLLI